MEVPVNEVKRISLLNQGKNQVIQVPPGLELPGTEVTIFKDGERLVIEPTVLALEDKRNRLRELLDSWDDLDTEWPDVDEGLLPADDIKL